MRHQRPGRGGEAKGGNAAVGSIGGRGAQAGNESGPGTSRERPTNDEHTDRADRRCDGKAEDEPAPGEWVLLRVTGDPERRVLVFDRYEWECFLDGARNGEFDDAADP